MGPHDGIRLCGACSTTSGDERTIPCGVLLEATVAEELAGMPDADRRVAERVSDLGEIEPTPGWEQRAEDRARREGVLPPADRSIP